MKQARIEDKDALFYLWKQSFVNKHRNELQFYYDYCFEKDKNRKCIMIERDQRVVSCLHMQKKNMHFNRYIVKYTYLFGAATHPDYRRKKYMTTLMNSAIDEASHNTLFTLLKTEDPEMFKPFGFETVYEHKEYEIYHKYFEDMNVENVCYTYKPEELYEAYMQFQSHFEGYELRDLQYFIDLDKLTFLHRCDICVYRNKTGKVEGYAWYSEYEDHVKVHEVIYTGSNVLKKMMKFICKERDYVHIEVSKGEMLEKIFPLAIPKQKSYMMVRLNQVELFNKLNQSEIKNAKEAFMFLEKPLWMNELF